MAHNMHSSSAICALNESAIDNKMKTIINYHIEKLAQNVENNGKTISRLIQENATLRRQLFAKEKEVQFVRQMLSKVY